MERADQEPPVDTHDAFDRWVEHETRRLRAEATDLIDSEDAQARQQRAAAVFAREARIDNGGPR